MPTVTEVSTTNVAEDVEVFEPQIVRNSGEGSDGGRKTESFIIEEIDVTPAERLMSMRC